jgi:hypothetical protein
MYSINTHHGSPYWINKTATQILEDVGKAGSKMKGSYILNSLNGKPHGFSPLSFQIELPSPV